MSALVPFLTLDQTCQQVQAWVNQQLTGTGFRVMPTFDLQVARLAHPECPCPHHGTDECNCQMIILLIYGNKGEPATLIIHGQEEKARLSLAIPVNGHGNQHLEIMIQRILMPHRAERPASIKVDHEVQTKI